MKLLETQEEFERLWFDKDTSKRFLVYYTASWCKPCKQLDLDYINALLNGIDAYKCDESINSYTPGYAGVRKFPTFVYYSPGKEISRLSSNNTQAVNEWIHSLCPDANIT